MKWPGDDFLKGSRRKSYCSALMTSLQRKKATSTVFINPICKPERKIEDRNQTYRIAETKGIFT